ncbi:hypothetical protein HKBW3C_03083, partial [Candidatus Hakubella thermalkaliphila]
RRMKIGLFSRESCKEFQIKVLLLNQGLKIVQNN